ncbi:MAG: glycoside hydrolase family 32 protein [Muribaculaceae bacterium]|nr:glycoside hydrolase family 32 protein [Muribaculaceae bacterium]
MKRIITSILLTLNVVVIAKPNDTTLYREQYRPQYHFTPAHRWIGDPCGLVHHNGRFMAYSWGGYESADLIHWTELNDHAIHGVPKGISTFTGSVVVDRNNTAGFGNDAYIAAFTSFDEASKKQSQSIAFSHNSGHDYQYYDLNPVLDIWSTEFRDPTVIWHEPSKQWIMLVARALEKKVAFYGSQDLKQWKWLSDFGPAGDSEKSWECPDMFMLPVDGNAENKKWVLVVSVNWDREQYFTGEFDGTGFICDSPDSAPQYIDHGIDYYASRVFQDYDGTLPDTYSIGWVSKWDYAGQVPTKYGKGVWSLPRVLSLKSTPDGLRLVQQPYGGLKNLRGTPFTYNIKLNPGVTPLKELSKLDNVYEIDATFTTAVDNTVGFILCEGKDCKVTLSYDTASGTLILDRTYATQEDIPKFDRVAHTHVKPSNGEINFNIFVDKSVIEIYAGNGDAVLTALTFPDTEAVIVEAFALRKGTEMSLKVYPMQSVH